jgi:hypothetical protein
VPGGVGLGPRPGGRHRVGVGLTAGRIAPALAELYASDPALAQACVDLTPRLRRTAEILLAGLIPSRNPADR